MDFLVLVPIAEVYIVLQNHNRTFALLGSLLAIFYSIYDVSATELNSLALVSLSQGYAGAATETLKNSFLSAAAYGLYPSPSVPLHTFCGAFLCGKASSAGGIQ